MGGRVADAWPYHRAASILMLPPVEPARRRWISSASSGLTRRSSRWIKTPIQCSLPQLLFAAVDLAAGRSGREAERALVQQH